jgi:hypothetical protein
VLLSELVEASSKVELAADSTANNEAMTPWPVLVMMLIGGAPSSSM